MKPSKEKKVFEKKFFAIFIEMERSSYLSVQYAYNLEEAFQLAKIEYSKIKNVPSTHNVLSELATAHVGLFVSKTFAELNDPKKHILPTMKKGQTPPALLPPPPKIETQADIKNKAMAIIIRTKDFDAIDCKQNGFSGAEKEYMRAEIKKLSTTKKEGVDKL